MVIYRTKEGDTLTSVARAHGVLPTDLAEINRPAEDGSLPIGRALLIRTPGGLYHTREGDTARRIARSHRTSCARLCQLNPGLDPEGELPAGRTVITESADAPLGALSVLGFALAKTPAEEIAPYLPYLSYLAILSATVNEEGGLTLPEDGALVALARRAGVVPLITLTAAGKGGAAGEAARRAVLLSGGGTEVINGLAEALRKRGYGGVLLDLGRVKEEEREAYTALLVRLRHRLGHTAAVLASLPAGEGESCAPVGRAASAVLLETHAFSSHFSAPAPAAPYDRVKEEAECAAHAVRPQKLLLGISTRALDFPVGGSRGRPLPFREVEARMQRGGRLGYDPLGRFPYLSYREEGCERILFFEDVESLYEKLLLTDRLSLGGVALFPTVGADPALLSLIAELFRIVKPHGE